MSFELFEKLELKVQQAIETVILLQMEVEELKNRNNTLSRDIQEAEGNRELVVHENESLKQELDEIKQKNAELSREIQDATGSRELLTHENEKLKQYQHSWQERIHMLLSKMEEV